MEFEGNKSLLLILVSYVSMKNHPNIQNYVLLDTKYRENLS